MTPRKREPNLQNIRPPRTATADRIREAWAPRPAPERLYFNGPLQERRETVPGAPGWTIVAIERREPMHHWVIQVVHDSGASLLYPMPYYSTADRDREIERVRGVLTRPLYAPGEFRLRDHTCPHCHLTERDAAREGLCIYCRKPKRAGWQLGTAHRV